MIVVFIFFKQILFSLNVYLLHSSIVHIPFVFEKVRAAYIVRL